MKFCFASLLAVLPILSEIHAFTVPRLAVRQNDLKKNTNTKKADGTKVKSADAAQKTNGKQDNKNKDDDPQTSLTLDPRVIGQSFKLTGQETPTPGQVASLTTTNNFINHCLTKPNIKLTDGLQSADETCNTTPIGFQVAFKNMPSCKFVFPPNMGNVAPNTPFTVKMAIKNLETGNFANADTKYFAAPQEINGAGLIQGHSHVVIEKLESLTQTDPLDPTKFAFFKGLNDKAQGGILTADVSKGLPAGAYRMCSINSSTNHAPVMVGKAQHGSMDDCSYFEAKAGGKGNDNTNKQTATAKENPKSTSKSKKRHDTDFEDVQ